MCVPWQEMAVNFRIDRSLHGKVIDMKNLSDKIKKALEQCMQPQGCAKCPYKGRNCVVELSGDALGYIRQLERDMQEVEE